MTTSFAEDFDNQIRESVDDRGLLHELGVRVHHAEDFDDAFDSPQVTEHLLEHRELIDCRQACTLVSLFDADIDPEFADDLTAIGSPRSFPGEKYEIARPDAIHIVGDRLRRGWQHDAQCFESCFRVKIVFPRISLGRSQGRCD